MAGNTPGDRLVAKAGWLDPIAGVFGAIVGAFYRIPGTGPVKILLHGTWPFRHPLHPLITDVTIGGYTMLVALDLLYLWRRDASLLQAADFVLLLAFLSSLLSALSGLTDWNDTGGSERRLGILHGLLMVAATLGFLAAIVWRLGGDPAMRDVAIYAGFASYAIVAVGAYLGGELPFGLGVGVQRLAWSGPVPKWEPLDVVASSLEDRKPRVGTTKEGLAVFVAKVDSAIYAIGNTCTHRGCDLNFGTWVGRDRTEIECDCHRSVFSVKTGTVRRGPATASEPSFETRVNEAGKIEVRSKA